MAPPPPAELLNYGDPQVVQFPFHAHNGDCQRYQRRHQNQLDDALLAGSSFCHNNPPFRTVSLRALPYNASPKCRFSTQSGLMPM
jgi:hypothetical protein